MKHHLLFSIKRWIMLIICWRSDVCCAMALMKLFFCNSRGELCEGAATNLFFVRNRELLTPQLSCGILPGIMRRFILEHFPVTECVLRPSDLTSMDECFVTNSLMGIMPVQSLDSYTFHPYGMYADIQNFYAEYVRLHRTPWYVFRADTFVKRSETYYYGWEKKSKSGLAFWISAM